MKIRRNKKDRGEKQTQSFQETVLLGDNDDSTQSFNKKPKERRSLGGKVEKSKTKTSRFSRFSLRNLLKKTSVAPDMNFTVATGSPAVEFGIDQTIPHCTGYIDDSSVEKNAGYMSLDAGITPPKRGMLKKFDSSLAERKVAGDYKTDDAGHTPKSKGKLKDVDPSKILKLLSTAGKENHSLSMVQKKSFSKQQPKKKKGLLRSKSDKSYDQVVPDSSVVSHNDSQLPILSAAKATIAAASPRIDLFGKTPRFASVCEVTPVRSHLSVSKSGKKRNSSALDGTFVTRDAGSTPKRTKSMYHSRRSAYLQQEKVEDVPTKLNLSLNGVSSDEEIVACASELMAKDEGGTIKRKATTSEPTKRASKRRPPNNSSENHSEGVLNDPMKRTTRNKPRKTSSQPATKPSLIPSSSDEDIIACAADLMAHDRAGTVRRNNTKNNRKGIETGKPSLDKSNNCSIKDQGKQDLGKKAVKNRSRQNPGEETEDLMTKRTTVPATRRSSARLAAKAVVDSSQSSGQSMMEEISEERLV